MRPQSTRDRLNRFLSLFKSNSNVLVLINPDPDSIASALAVKRLLWKHVHKTSIAYIEEIKRLDNLTMVELLKIQMKRIDEIDTEDFSDYIIVDSQPDHSVFFTPFAYNAIIDHHPKVEEHHASYIDIRPEYGANSTILTEYLRSAGIKPSMRLATALLYAIKTDTGNFERSGIEADVNQFRYLFKYANMNLLKKIEKSELRPDDLDFFQTALMNRILTKKKIYAHAGEVPSADICVQIADFFTKVHGVGWAFVSGVYEDRIIVIIRNDGYRKDAGHLASIAFGDVGSAGGHRGAARAEIPLDFLVQNGISDHNSVIESFVKKRLKI
ncbi:MAG: DHH family phosphoesterase [Thermodesulfobacteriota bacterium]|nr:DHH family phosphoesterase [Thermodesulfobacteriota bacterium]